MARLAGVAAAGVALGVGELVTGLSSGATSLVASVGSEVVDRASGGIVKSAIEAFGTNDKAVLLTSIVVVCLALGGLVGGAAVRRPWVAPASFGAAGLLGAVAGVADPSSSGGAAFAAALLAALAGWATLRVLLSVLVSGRALPVSTGRRAPVAGGAGDRARSAPDGPVADGTVLTVTDVPGRASGDRRAFFAWTGAAAAFAGVAAVAGKNLSTGSTAETARATIALPPVTLPPATAGAAGAAAPVAPDQLAVDGISPLVTPNDDFYRIDTALIVPQVDPTDWKLEIKGEDLEPYSLTFDELLALPMIEAPVTIACVSNEVGGDLVGTAVWQGVPLTTILERAGVRPGGVPASSAQLVGRSVDGFTVGFPTDVALDGRIAMVAVGMNGEPLPVRHGFPARLIVAGLYGYVSATKWLSTIELTGWDDFDAYWIPRGWAKEAPVKTQSRIDVPRSGATLAPGPVPVAGVAWAPTRGIARVEVQVDDGPWQEARLGPGWDDDVWRQWVFDWDAIPGSHTLRVRATDGNGDTQTGERRRVDPDGATGWHSRQVSVST
jgi:DMSO/TMAO reductase YedYZ molybdopterin-dependent catalytic subunit